MLPALRRVPLVEHRTANLGTLAQIIETNGGETRSGFSAGYAYSTADAFKISAVVACVGLRAGAFAQLPLKGYAEVGSQSKLLDVQPMLLSSPSEVVVPSVWKTQMSISRDIWGFAAGMITAVDGAGFPAHVEWLPPDLCHARQEHYAGPIEWSVAGAPFDASLIFHVPSRFVVPGNPLGMSPLEKSGLVDLAKRAQDFGRDWFRNGAVPSSIIYADDPHMTGEQADGILKKLAERWAKRQPGFLGSGLRYDKVSVPANESQFLETLRQAAADIAVSFNLPPEKINAVVTGQSLTYANRDQNVQQYLMDSINPDLVVVQETVERHMRAGTYPRFSTGAFLRSDLKTRYESYKTGLEAAFITIDEVRAWEELPPLPPTGQDLTGVPI